MRLSEKIYYCRKKAGLSQEGLAERIGVSRQAVSKWETGDSEPELGKLRQLAAAFEVSTDWLLSEEEPEQPVQLKQSPQESPAASRSGLDSLPAFLGHAVRKYGWLYGVYIAVGGFFFTLIGIASAAVGNSMVSGFHSAADSMFSSMGGYGSWGIQGDSMMGLVNQTTSSLNTPITILSGFVIFVGLILLIGGTILAVYLKKKGMEKKPSAK